MENIELPSLVQKAYKKLKASVFFDKTQLVLRDRIVEYESSDLFDSDFKSLIDSITDGKKWDTFSNSLLNTISYSSFPKEMSNQPIDDAVISNWLPEKVDVNKAQYFIEICVEGQILGILWLLLIGIHIDEDIYEHSYGNRLKKNLINSKTNLPTLSPYLFEPYYQQYENWRDKALDYAQKALNRDQDVLILTLDFKRFFYQVNIDRENFDAFLERYKEKYSEIDFYILQRINEFVFSVIEKYSRILENEYMEIEGRNILPIGFFPSNVLANWSLNKFDDAIINGWNPTYYGRYVDDIIIVDKIEKRSSIYQKAKRGDLKTDEVVGHYLLNCSAWEKNNSKCESKKHALLVLDDKPIFEADKCSDSKKSKKIYAVNSEFNTSDKSKIILQNDKIKIFYFNAGHSDALLKCFRQNISKNKSEFRFMPEDEAVFQDDDYTEIYDLQDSESINKLRGLDGVSIDKFNLSKFLGKYLRISGLVNDKIESQFEKDIDVIFNNSTIIENYSSWEKVIEILVINDKFKALIAFVDKVINSINRIHYESGDEEQMKVSLLNILKSALCKSFCLNWGPKVSECMDEIVSIIAKSGLVISDFDFTNANFKILRKNYCLTRMCDKYAMPLLIEWFIDNNKLTIDDSKNLNLTRFDKTLDMKKATELSSVDYIFYPYLVNTYDITMYMTIYNLKTKQYDHPLMNMCIQVDKEKEIFLYLNYRIKGGKESDLDACIEAKKMKGLKNAFGLKVGNSYKDHLNIAVANARLDEKDFLGVMLDKPNRKYNRYSYMASLINHAIRDKADLLVMPESYVPVEWLMIIARTCAKNNLAIVTGVEHFKIDSSKVCNLTAVILPYEYDDQKCAHIHFHTKIHYAPREKMNIRGYRYEPFLGQNYELYNWNDCWFPVYCCYELASIHDRSIFQSYADAIIAVEWNSDTNYYSNIVESMCRDLHCYCIQVNSSNYGDSRIARPSKKDTMDIIKMKGGKNSAVLVDSINIKSLREFQMKEYELQQDSDEFKPTPPDIDRDIIAAKMKHELWNMDGKWE